MRENLAKEKLRVTDIIKENAGMVITIGGFIFLMFQFVLLPIQETKFKIDNILDNHLSTIQQEMTEAKSERHAQTTQLNALSEQLIRLSTQLEKK